MDDGVRRLGPQYRGGSDGDLAPTKAQLRILELLSRGLTIQQAADAEGIGRTTVKTHLEHVRARLRAKTKTHAVAEAIRMGLIP